MMQRLILVAAALLLHFGTVGAQVFTVSGYITDAASGEPVIGAAVILESGTKGRVPVGTVSGNSGYYSISLEAGETTLLYSYLGYKDRSVTVMLDGNKTLNIGLEADTQMLENAVVTAHRAVTGARSTQMSAIEVPVNQIKAIPAIGGEVDIIKALQLLPGVQSGSEGSAGLYVRGGGADENLLLMDGVPLYNVNHLFGFFSIFNADAVKNVTLYKGSFPARFGGHLSSVVDVRLNDGNDREIHGNASIGLISSKFNLEGPIVKGRTTFNISARRTYMDLLTKPALMYANKKSREDSENYDTANGGYDFYDLNAKITHKFKNDDRLTLSFYSGDDVAGAAVESRSAYDQYDYIYDDDYNVIGRTPTGIRTKYGDDLDMKWKWGNMVASLRWNHEITPRLYLSAAASMTRYRSRLSVALDETSSTIQNRTEIYSDRYSTSLCYDSAIGDYGATADFDWRPSPRHDIKFGGSYTHHIFKPGIIALKMKSSSTGEKDQNFSQKVGDKGISSEEFSIYSEDNLTVTQWLKANIGIHASSYSVNGKTYISAEPRLSTRALITDRLSFKASYSEMSQYIHLLCNSSISLPSDLWVPVTNKIKPMRSHQTAAGFCFDKDKFEYSVEAYWKTMDNVLEYKDGASYFSTSTAWEDRVCMGKGWSYGVEFLVQKKLGKTTGWIGYTLAKAMRQFDKQGMIINGGNPFPAKYDRRHDLSATVSHEFSKKFDISATFIFASGNRGTLSFEDYPTITPDDYYDLSRAWSSSYISQRNNFRMPSYNRFDIGMNFHKAKKHGTAIWNVSIYNVYNRQNPYLLMVDTHFEYDDVTGETESWPVLKQVSIFPIMPSFSYTFKF